MTIERILSTSSDWGYSFLHAIKDGDGNVTISGTVKKRDDYKGIKQTVLNRVKVTKK